MKIKKELTLSILGILGLIAITAGVTYAFFNYTKEGTTDNTVTTGTITFLYNEVSGVGKGISLSDAYPISDSQGKAQTGEGKVFDFKVTSTTPSNSSIPYEITARKKIVENILDEEAVKIYLTKVSGTVEDEVLLDNYSNLNQTTKVESTKYTEKIIYNGKVPANSTNYEQNFRLRMWVDEAIDFSPVKDEQGNDTYPYNNKEFTVTVNVYANAKVVTDEDIENESKAEISNITVDGTELTKVENSNYDYETSLPEGTTSTTINIETISENATIKVERIDSLAYSKSNIKRLSATKILELVNGDNYFKITVISENKKIENEYKIKIRVGKYTEALLNGADPVLTDNLVAVEIDNAGKVTKASLQEEWYDYETKKWANAVVLKDTSITYNDNQEIPESNIESYFVWIPKYSYQLWDLGNYSDITDFNNSKPHTIPIKFGLINTSDSVTGECTTPGTAGANGNCAVGEYMTHPAFLAFDTNGLWIGKFETGYDGATSTETAQVNSSDSSKIIIKPNVYSWRNLTVGNMFKASYDYLRSDESHMMKNTEWASAVYLQHSVYGSQGSSRINNNGSYITGYAGIEEPTKGYSNSSIEGNRQETTILGVDGTYTMNYLNSNSVVASTTGNYTGIYDMSGGAWEYVMGYTTGSSIGVGGLSEITSLHSAFFTNSGWNKYYDKYSSTAITNYSNRILGDATGEMGPFGSEKDPDGNTRYKSSWYKDYTRFADSSHPWFTRGGAWSNGTHAGVFAFTYNTGGVNVAISFRVTLAP